MEIGWSYPTCGVAQVVPFNSAINFLLSLQFLSSLGTLFMREDNLFQRGDAQEPISEYEIDLVNNFNRGLKPEAPIGRYSIKSCS